MSGHAGQRRQRARVQAAERKAAIAALVAAEAMRGMSDTQLAELRGRLDALVNDEIGNSEGGAEDEEFQDGGTGR